jgi:hypothetical protein
MTAFSAHGKIRTGPPTPPTGPLLIGVVLSQRRMQRPADVVRDGISTPFDRDS